MLSHIDPFEMTNLAANPKYFKKLNEMTALLEARQKKFNDVQPLIVDNPKQAQITVNQINARIKEKRNKPKKQKKND